MSYATMIDVKLPRLHSGQRNVIKNARRFNVVCCGRRWGKSLLGIERAGEAVLDGGLVGWFAPTYKLLLEVWRDLTQRLRGAATRISEQERRLELLTKGILEFWSLDNPDAGKSRHYDLVIIDEAAMVGDLERAWTAIRPTLMDTAGDAWFLSTPKGLNFFHTLFSWGTDHDEWASWQKPTADNPYIDQNEIEEARRQMPEKTFAQEILAQFIEDGAGVFRGILQHAIIQEKAMPNHSYVIGVDWGKHEDFTVLTVIDATLKQVVFVDRFNQIDYTLQRGRLKALWERFEKPAVIAEKNSMGDPVIEGLHREGLPVQPFLTTNASKAAAIEALALAFERQELTIPSHPILLNELQAFQAERLPSGLLRYGAPNGMHDDCVMSLALAWHGAQRPRTTRMTVA